MKLKESGGFEDKPIECHHCTGKFKIETFPPKNDDDVIYCPYCGNKINPADETINDELVRQIEEAGDGE